MGLDAGTERLWLRHVDPLVADAIEASCTPEVCGPLDMALPGASIVFPGAFGSVIAGRGFSVQEMDLGGRAHCLDGADLVRVGIVVALGPAELRRLFGVPADAAVPDALLRMLEDADACHDRDDEGLCDLWMLTLEVGARAIEP